MVYYDDYTDFACIDYNTVKYFAELSYCDLYAPQMQDWFFYF